MFGEMLRSLRAVRVSLSLLTPRLQCCRPCQTRTNQQLLRASCLSVCSPQRQAAFPCSDLASRKYTLIYAFPAIRVLRALSRLKLAQTGITGVLLPAVYCFYLQGHASFGLLSYTTGIAAFAGVMLYAISHYVRRVVGMMYLDHTNTTLKVSYLSFWGYRRDMYLPVLDVMTLGDTGDSPGEVILRLKRYSCSETLYFSTRLGHVIDKDAFEKVFGTLSQ